MKIRKAVHSRLIGGEGPLWDHRTNKLYWLDIENLQFYEYDPETRKKTKHLMPERISCIVPYGENSFAAATKTGISHLYFENNILKTTQIVSFNSDTNMTSNDGRCDSMGRFVVGMMHNEYHSGYGKMYIAVSKEFRCFDKGYTIPNGVAWSKDESKLYVAESKPGTIYEFDYSIENGSIKNKKILSYIAGSDGLCADENGNLWIAQCGLGKVCCLNTKTKTIDYEIKFPAKRVTSCFFGGKNMDTLFVTVAKWGKKDILKKSFSCGPLYMVENMPVKGIKAHPFKSI